MTKDLDCGGSGELAPLRQDTMASVFDRNPRETGALTPAMTDITITPAMLEAAIAMGPEGRESLKFLLETQREERAAWALREFNTALAAFQADCPTVKPNRKGAHGVSYADREQIMHTIQPFLSRHGLSVTYGAPQAGECSGEDFHVVCIVRHVSGHQERTPFTVPREKASNRMNVSQAEGSASEYAQRYALKLALNLRIGDRDDDGASAGYSEPVTEHQAAELRALADEVYPRDEQREMFLEKFKTDTFAGIPARDYQRAVSMMEARRKYLGQHPELAR